LIEGKQYLLCSANRERGNNKFSLFFKAGFFNPVKQRIHGTENRIMHFITIGAFQYNIICRRKNGGWLQKRASIPAHITAKHQCGWSAVNALGDMYAGTTYQVPGMNETYLYITCEIKDRFKFQLLEK
jgi:hypothetical protein